VKSIAPASIMGHSGASVNPDHPRIWSSVNAEENQDDHHGGNDEQVGEHTEKAAYATKVTQSIRGAPFAPTSHGHEEHRDGKDEKGEHPRPGRRDRLPRGVDSQDESSHGHRTRTGSGPSEWDEHREDRAAPRAKASTTPMETRLKGIAYQVNTHRTDHAGWETRIDGSGDWAQSPVFLAKQMNSNTCRNGVHRR
jgi:hypothetical protein